MGVRIPSSWSVPCQAATSRKLSSASSCSRAKVLLFYDLTRGVDVGTKAEIFRMMEELACDGAGILYYSSDVTELVNVPHRIVVVFEGHVIREFRHGECEEESLVRGDGR